VVPTDRVPGFLAGHDVIIGTTIGDKFTGLGIRSDVTDFGDRPIPRAMSRERNPDHPIEAVQNAAIEHALATGDSRTALALVGALDARPSAGGDSSAGGDGEGSADRDPVAVALTATVAAMIGQRAHLDRQPFAAEPASEPTTLPVEGDRETAQRIRAFGAAVACERFDVSAAHAATLAACDRSTVEPVLSVRTGDSSAVNDPSRER
jgi:hypothetical protein